MNSIIFEAVKLISMVVVAGVVLYVIPFIRAAIGTEKMNQILTWAEEAVRYAEQMLDDGVDKKAKALEILVKVRNEKNLPFTDEQLEILIEAAVNTMNEPNIQYVMETTYDE